MISTEGRLEPCRESCGVVGEAKSVKFPGKGTRPSLWACGAGAPSDTHSAGNEASKLWAAL